MGSIGPLLVDGWDSGNGDGVEVICMLNSGDEDFDEEDYDEGTAWTWVYDSSLRYFSKVKSSQEADKNVEIVDMFASTAQSPCMPSYNFTYPGYEPEQGGRF